MAKKKKKTKAKKVAALQALKAPRSVKAKPKPKPKPKSPSPRSAAGGLTFNHAMIYCRDVARSVAFYRDALGLRVVDEYPGGYARLRSPGSDSTIALHALEPGQQFLPANEGMRLYFEVKALDAFCTKLAANGVAFDQPPKGMPWGWKHAYLKDPDGHEISLYWAGAQRLGKTRMTGGDH